MKNEIITIGLIDLAELRTFRVLSMLKNVEVIFIDTDLQKAMNIGITHNVVVAEDIELFLGKVDAVIISSPTFTHANYLRQVAKYVKYIFESRLLILYLKPICMELMSGKGTMFKWALSRDITLQYTVEKGAEPIKKIVSIDFSNQ